MKTVEAGERKSSPCRRWWFFAMWVLSSMTALAVGLPPVEYADTETSTNIPFSVGVDGGGHFRLSLSCIATPSNNVEVAFGRDADHDGTLSLDEIAFVVGWDCGAWFMRQGCDGVHIESPAASTNAVGALFMHLRFGASGRPFYIETMASGQPVFPAEPPRWMNVRECDTLRLTGRGLYGHDETFCVSSTPDGIVIRFK